MPDVSVTQVLSHPPPNVGPCDNRDQARYPDSVVAVYATEADLITGVKHAQDAAHDPASLSFLGPGLSEPGYGHGLAPPSSANDRWAQWGALWGWIFGAFALLPELGYVAVGGYLLSDVLRLGTGSTNRSLRRIGLPSDHSPAYAADLRSNHFLVIAHGGRTEMDQAYVLLGQTSHARLDRHRS